MDGDGEERLGVEVMGGKAMRREIRREKVMGEDGNGDGGMIGEIGRRMEDWELKVMGGMAVR